MGQFLVLVGLLIVAVGLAIMFGLPLGRLPGDVVIRRGGFTFYFPIATCILISVLLTLVGVMLRR
jgi:Protein of unknown function (DUF2905)